MRRFTQLPAEPDVPLESRCELRHPRRGTPPHPCFSTRLDRAPDLFERDASHRVLTIRIDAPEHLDDVSTGLPQRSDLRDVQLRTDIFEWGILNRLDVECAQCEVRHDYTCDEPADRVRRNISR